MFATDTTPYMPPLPAALAVLPTPELMAIVMRRVGEGCGIDDFNEAAETCDIGEPRLRANLGAAKRILMMETERQVFPAQPLMPWDADPSYRVELVKRGGHQVATGLADTAAIVATLERGGFEVEAMLALWDDIVSEAIHQLHSQPRLSPLARIIADLDQALSAYEHADNNAEARQLAQSMRTALESLRDNQQLPRRHVMRTADAFADALEWGSFPVGMTAKVRAAVDLLRKLWGL